MKDTVTKDTLQRLLERAYNHLQGDSREIAQYGFEFQYVPLKRLKCAEIYGKVFIPDEKWIIGNRTHVVKAFWGVEIGFPDCKFVLTDKGVIEIKNI